MGIEDRLEAAFGRAEPDHFAWQTEHPYVARCERDLVREAFLPLGQRVLDVGCGEGATLVHLGSPEGAVGIDLFEDKLASARKRLPGCTFVAGSAYELPFADGAFDHVIVRDVIHHLERPEAFIAESARVLAPGGRIDVLEPCRNNPLIAAHGLLIPVERGELRSTMRRVKGLVGERFEVVATSRHQPMPLHRIVFHPSFGRPELARIPALSRAVSVVESLASRVVPAPCWAYLHVRATKKGPG